MYAISLARRDRCFKLSIVTVMDLRLASPCHVYYTLVGRVHSWMNSVTAVVSDRDRVGIPSQLTSVVLGLTMKFRPGLDGIVPSAPPHTRVFSTPVSLLTSLSYYASPAESIPSPECPIPSFDYRKSKCRKDDHPAASLQHHGGSQGLQA